MDRKYVAIGLILFSGIALVWLWIVVLVGNAEAISQAQEGEATPVFSDASDALTAAVNWLIETHQNADGGFASFSMGADQAPSDAGGTLDALLAIAAAGGDYEPLLAYLSENIEELIAFAAADGGTAGKTVFALTLAGQDPADFGGHDFVLDITGHISPTGEYGVTTAFNQSTAMLGLAFAGESIPAEAAEWMLNLQSTEEETAGSWDDGFGTLGNTDSTAMAILALLAADYDGNAEVTSTALDFLVNTRLPSGGWEYGKDFGENANSTALVIQAAIAAGEDIFAEESRWSVDGLTPARALMNWQSESGAFQADFGDGRFDDFFSTVQSIPALALIARSDEVAAILEITPTPTFTPEPEATNISVEEVLEDIPTETPTSVPEPTPVTEVTVSPATVAEAVESGVDTQDEAESQSEPETGTGIASGGSIIPFIVVGLVIVIIIAFIGWMVSIRK